MWSSVAMSVAALVSSASGMDDGQAITGTLVPKGAFEKVGYMQALGVELGESKPDLIKKEPADLKAPKYGVFRFGHFFWLGGPSAPPKVTTKPEEAPSFAAILDEPADGPTRLFVDTNRDGDLTNDPAPEWKLETETGMDGTDLKQHIGSAAFNLGTEEKPRLVHLAVNRFDQKDVQRAAASKYLVAFRDYLLTADLKLGEKTYPTTFTDEWAIGDFRGVTPAGAEGEPTAAAEQIDPMQKLFASGILMLIDVNGNGRIDQRGEAFNPREPFNIGGTTYELADMAADGASFKVVKSSKTVAEIKPPPDHSEGKKITPFEAILLDGKKVKFPDDFKGKVVLLDFWATWCGPCMHEVPNVVAAYEKLRGQGFEVLGVSLDQAGATEKLKSVLTDKKMIWPQIYDGKGWQSTLADLYCITGIPACWLVDGDTGLIVADESKLRGEQLTGTVEKALADKKGAK
jgi:thiol-disulfide isomerase/thioredoxin